MTESVDPFLSPSATGLRLGQICKTSFLPALKLDVAWCTSSRARSDAFMVGIDIFVVTEGHQVKERRGAFIKKLMQTQLCTHFSNPRPQFISRCVLTTKSQATQGLAKNNQHTGDQRTTPPLLTKALLQSMRSPLLPP